LLMFEPSHTLHETNPLYNPHVKNITHTQEKLDRIK